MKERKGKEEEEEESGTPGCCITFGKAYRKMI